VGIYLDRIDLDNSIYSRAGSIGVVLPFSNYSEYFKKEGIETRNIYAPESTHKNLEFEEAQKGNDEPMKNNVLSPLAKKFQDDVKKRRGDKLNCNAEGILNGAMFFEEDSVKHGLADGKGTLGDSIQRVMDMVEVRKFMRR
jgi:protease-4